MEDSGKDSALLVAVVGVDEGIGVDGSMICMLLMMVMKWKISG